jgi:WS/DGAT/MGAT family acyltransferase
VKTHPLNPLDISWTQVESRDTPMHVAGLMPFTLPEDASPGFLRDLVADLRSAREFAPPWNYCLRGPGLLHPRPVWVEQDTLDLEYHVRHSALPRPGGERELGQLVARLHSQPLDLTRPPWEYHVIEGLEGGRFAIYLKMHHSLIDGISGVRLLTRSMSDDPQKSLGLPPFWSPQLDHRSRGADKVAAPLTLDGVLQTVMQAVGSQVRSVPQLVKAFTSMITPGEGEAGLQVPFDAPKSVMNGRVRGQRRVATQLFALDRLKAVARAGGCTLNDVVLAICGGGLRKFLMEEDLLPEKPLTAGIPVNVRAADDEGTGTQVTFIIGTLGTDIEDPRDRLRAVAASTRAAKAHFGSLPREAITQYTMLLMAPTILGMLTPIAGRTRPMFNVTVSNVPGPTRPLYYRGARLEASYPISLISHGIGLNITCQSYADVIAFAFVGCRDTLPHLQNVAVYTAEALAELEASMAAPPPERKAAGKARLKKVGGRKAGGEKPAVRKKAAARSKPARTGTRKSPSTGGKARRSK